MARLSPTRFRALDGNGDPLSGGLLYSYEAGTTTPKSTYTTEDESVANANPVVLDSDGYADVWLGEGSYKLVLKTSADVTIWTIDNVAGDSSASFLGKVFAVSANVTVSSAYQNAHLYCTSSPTLSLLAAADANEGFSFIANNAGAGTVTIDPDGSETINGSATLTLAPTQWAIVTCDGTNWVAVSNSVIKNNLSASTAPTATDDASAGYSVGSLWIDTTNDEAYRCVDSTTSAAVWVNSSLEIGDLGSAASATLIDDDTFATATSTNVPSAESVKTYVDNQISGTSGTLGTPVTLTNQTAVDFTSIPSGTTRIYVYGYDFSTSGTSDPILQLGDSGGFETTGYVGNISDDSGTSTSYTTNGFYLIQGVSAANVYQMFYTLHLVNASTNTWMIEGGFARTSSTFTGETIGRKSLSAELTQLRITTVNGTDQFDAGVFNIRYE